MKIYTIYENPSDYPGKFVVRGATYTGIKDTEPTAVTDDLAKARETIPAGLACIGRAQNDDPVIKEVWL